MWTLLWKFMLLALSTIIFYILFSKEKLIDKRRKGFWKKITPKGRVYLTIYALSVLGQAWIDYAETVSKKQMYDDLKTALTPKDRAKLSFCSPVAEMKTNPFPTAKDSDIDIKFHICDEGNDDATHITDTCVIAGWVNNRRFFSQLRTRQTNADANIPIGQLGVIAEYTLRRPPHTYYVYFKMTYTNSKGQYPDTLRNIFYINGLDARDSYQNEYDSIKGLITEKNMW